VQTAAEGAHARLADTTSTGEIWETRTA